MKWIGRTAMPQASTLPPQIVRAELVETSKLDLVGLGWSRHPGDVFESERPVLKNLGLVPPTRRIFRGDAVSKPAVCVAMRVFAARLAWPSLAPRSFEWGFHGNGRARTRPQCAARCRGVLSGGWAGVLICVSFWAVRGDGGFRVCVRA